MACNPGLEAEPLRGTTRHTPLATRAEGHQSLPYLALLSLTIIPHPFRAVFFRSFQRWANDGRTGTSEHAAQFLCAVDRQADGVARGGAGVGEPPRAARRRADDDAAHRLGRRRRTPVARRHLHRQGNSLARAALGHRRRFSRLDLGRRQQSDRNPRAQQPRLRRRRSWKSPRRSMRISKSRWLPTPSARARGQRCRCPT